MFVILNIPGPFNGQIVKLFPYKRMIDGEEEDWFRINNTLASIMAKDLIKDKTYFEVKDNLLSFI